MTSPSILRLFAAGGAHVDRRGRLCVPFTPGASHPGTMRETVGGGAFNAARAAAGRGALVSLLSARGGDAGGTRIADAIAHAGLHDLGATFLDRASPSYTSVLGEDGEQIVGLADMALYETAFDRLLRRKRVRDALREADAILADANLPASAMGRLVALAGDRPLHAMAISPAKALHWRPVLRHVACLFCNQAEAAALTGRAPGTPAPALADALSALGVRRAMVTAGGGPLTLLDAGQVTTLHPPPARAIDVTGAGDALTGAAVAALMRNRNLRDAAMEGLAAAALAVETVASAPDLAGAPYQDRLIETRRLNGT
ncbi:MAG: PfkB family carbohydrate kinase [Zhengella sp.]|uniref:PfkB family carbohydrate kinase n=1 Tax=Zhengella sp. TaxID=2282762 RepID=UPI0035270FDB